MQIRWRLTLWFSLILCAVLILCGVAFHTLLHRSLRNDVDDNLKVHSANVQRTLNLEDIPAPIDYDTGCGCLPSVDEFVHHAVASPAAVAVNCQIPDRFTGLFGGAVGMSPPPPQAPTSTVATNASAILCVRLTSVSS